MLRVIVWINWMSVFVAFFTEGRHATLIVTPLNRAAIKGTEVAMDCYGNTTIKPIWRMQLDQSADDSTLFDGNRFVGHLARLYKLRGDVDNEFTLVMNATEETARRYICEEPGYQRVSAELVVLASDPVCSIVQVIASDDYFQVEMQCTIRYWGNWSPTMDWTKSSEILSENSIGSAQITEITESVRTMMDKGISKSLLIITGKRHEVLLVYNCTTRFKVDQKPTYTTAANIPDYAFTWSSPAITISPDTLSPSFVPLLAVAIFLMVALTVTSACLLIVKRKLKAHNTFLPEGESTQGNTTALVSSSRIERADENISQQVRVADGRDLIRNTGENYEYIEVARETIETPEHYMELNVRKNTVAMQEYVALAKKTKTATEIPISSVSQLENVIKITDSHQDMNQRYGDVDLARETTGSSHNLLQLTRQTRPPTTNEYLELIDDTASNMKSPKRISLDFLIPILNETNY